MKKAYIIAMTLAGVCLALLVQGQDVAGNLEKARNAYGSGDLQASRYALQQALADVDQALGREILSLLPTEIESLPYREDEDQVTSNAAGITGMYVNRAYRNEKQSLEVELIDDSPLLGTINRLLSLPAFMGIGDPNQKRIKIQGYKGLLEKNTHDSTGVVNYQIQVPFNKSLFTFRSVGFDSENQVIGMAERLPLKAIVRMTR